MKKTVAGLLAAALVFTAGGGALLCAGQAGALRKTAAGGAHTDLSTGSDLRLDYDSESRSFRVQDSYGYTWDSIVGDDLYDYERLNDSWKRNVTSVLNIQYADISGVNPAIKTAFSSEESTAVTSAMQGDTMVITYAFGCGITLSVHAAVQDGTVRFSIPADSIVEDDKNKLLSAELLPYFGASTEEEEGYFFYPDGCGAIKNHYSEASTTIRNMSYTFSLYGSEFNTIDTLLSEQKQGEQTAYLPVFGIKKGDAACIAYSHQGEAESQIVMYPSGASIDQPHRFFVHLPHQLHHPAVQHRHQRQKHRQGHQRPPVYRGDDGGGSRGVLCVPRAGTGGLQRHGRTLPRTAARGGQA